MTYFNQESENTSDSSSNINSNNKPNSSSNNTSINEEQRMILEATHPLDFEQSSQTSSANQPQQKQLTITQKAIIACMEMNGGMASESQILRFIRKHWQFIRRNTTKEYRDPANIRLLHINFRTKKNKVFLFVEAEKGSGIWKCNTDASNSSLKGKSASFSNSSSFDSSLKSDKSSHSNYESNDGSTFVGYDNKFEDLIVNLLRENSQGLTLDEIVDLAAPFINAPGYMIELNEMDIEGKGRRRIRATLIVKLHLNEVVKDENTQKWFLKNSTSSHFFRFNNCNIPKKFNEDFPECLKNFRITELSADELWKIVRKTQ